MRRRVNSESDNSITQVIVEEQQEELYKDKVKPIENFSTIFRNFIKSESSVPANKPPVQERYPTEFETEPEIEFVMTARDRTGEFANTIRSLQGNFLL